jgi:MoxR-like ATPase
VNSTLGNLKSLALAVASGRGICLQGPVGSGKTSLVEHLALLTGTWKEVMFSAAQCELYCHVMYCYHDHRCI